MLAGGAIRRARARTCYRRSLRSKEHAPRNPGPSIAGTPSAGGRQSLRAHQAHWFARHAWSSPMALGMGRFALPKPLAWVCWSATMATKRQLLLIEPQRLYDTYSLAALVGLSTAGIRKVTAGIRTSPFIPRVTRLGAKTVRFLGKDILAWLDDPAGASEQARPRPQALPKPTLALPAQAQRRRPGRPSNRERDAALRAGGAA